MKFESNTYGSCIEVIRQASIRARFLNLTKAIVAGSLMLVSPLTVAEITSDSYSCVLGEQSREITLVYLQNPNQVPCEIRETKNNADTRALWRANNDSAFCRRQFESYRKTLEGNGWPCESGSSANSNDAVAVASLTSSTSPLVSIATVSSTVTVAEPNTQETLQSNSAFSEARLTPTPPAGTNGNLTPEDIREMDDWLIYLSAQTMASIRRLVPDPDDFEVYLQQEQLDSSNIYERLQNRIEFLNRLLANQVSAPVKFSEAEF